MRNGSTLARAAMSLVAGAFLAAAAPIAAQCTPTPGGFQKVVLDLGTGFTPGSTVEYRVMLCNDGANPCAAGQFNDDLDDTRLFNPDTTPPVPRNPPEMRDLSYVPYVATDVPPPIGCTAPDLVGNAICREGAKPVDLRTFDPKTLPEDLTLTARCGEDCAAPGELLQFALKDRTRQLPAGRCYFMVFKAKIADSTVIDRPECICNYATFTRVIPPTTRILYGSTNPAGAPPDPLPPGCDPAKTCQVFRTGEPCDQATCFTVDANSNLGATSEKCILATPCGTTAAKVPDAPITYNVAIENTGNVVAREVRFQDSMTQLSDTGAECINTTTAPPTVPVASVVCSWVSPCPMLVEYDVPSKSIVFRTLVDIPPKGKITFDIVGQVAATANGNCTNDWRLFKNAGNPTTNEPISLVKAKPVFNVQSGVLLDTSTKCIDDKAVPPVCVATTVKVPGDPVSFKLRFTNTGNLDALNATITDDLQATALGCTGGITNPTIGSCTLGGPATCPSGPCPGGTNGPPVITGGVFSYGEITLPRNGCFVEVVLNGTVAASAAGNCCNHGTMAYGGTPKITALTPNACFTSGPVASLDLGKALSVGQSSTPPPNADVNFDVIVANTTNPPAAVNGINLVDTLDPCFQVLGPNGQPCGANVTCTPAVDCPNLATTCTYSNGGRGFTVNPWNLAGGRTVTFKVTARTGATSTGVCNNNASISAPINLGPSNANVNITPQAVLNITKVPVPSSVPPSTSAATKFTITVTNSGTAAATGCTMTDNVAAGPPANCITLNACGDPTDAPPITYTCNTPPNTVTSALFNLAASGGQQIMHVTANSGATLGPCNNTVTVTCQTGLLAPVTASGSVTIGTAASCDLAVKASATATPKNPTFPPTLGPWVYTQACPPKLNTLDEAVKITNVVTNTLTTVSIGVSPDLTLMQLTCPSSCGPMLKFTKASGFVKIYIQ